MGFILEAIMQKCKAYFHFRSDREKYHYNSILHYSATAFSKDNESVTLLPRVGEPDMIGKKSNLSDTDIVKIKKMYKCKPYEGWQNRCSRTDECGLNEFASCGSCTTGSAEPCCPTAPSASTPRSASTRARR